MSDPTGLYASVMERVVSVRAGWTRAVWFPPSMFPRRMLSNPSLRCVNESLPAIYEVGHDVGRMVTAKDEWSRSRTNGHDQGRMVTDPIRSRTGDDASTVEITQLEKGDESPRRAGS